MKLKNIPNILSAFRILFALAFPFVFFGCYPQVLPAMLLFVMAGLTDILDGRIARRYACISKLGKILDPVADKLMQAMVLICLCVKGIIPLWLPVISIVKELALLCGAALILRRDNTVVVSGWPGKLAVCVFYAAMLVLAVFEKRLSSRMTFLICLVTLCFTLLALCFYLTRFLGAEKRRRASLPEKTQAPD